jgi:hypothetical protein
VKNRNLRLLQIGQAKYCFSLERFDVFRRAMLAASHAVDSMVVQLEADGPEAGPGLI